MMLATHWTYYVLPIKSVSLQSNRNNTYIIWRNVKKTSIESRHEKSYVKKAKEHWPQYDIFYIFTFLCTFCIESSIFSSQGNKIIFLNAANKKNVYNHHWEDNCLLPSLQITFYLSTSKRHFMLNAHIFFFAKYSQTDVNYFRVCGISND